jgi:HTH-type transcriptional regulator/antitoxin HigA
MRGQPLRVTSSCLTREKSYDRIVALLDSLIDEVGEDASHPLASLMEVLGVLIERYEAEHIPELIVG